MKKINMVVLSALVTGVASLGLTGCLKSMGGAKEHPHKEHPHAEHPAEDADADHEHPSGEHPADADADADHEHPTSEHPEHPE